MPDMSSLDKKYIIDNTVYNCPFCNRNHVAYVMREDVSFDWSNEERCFVYFLECLSCGKKSMHLSKVSIPLEPYTYPNGHSAKRFSQMRTAAPGDGGIAQKTPEPDSVIFYSVPTSFFTVDSSIPRILRDLYAEAEGCHKSGFLTGASACIRKVVYELAVNKNAEGGNYEDRIKSLKQTVPDVDGSYFDVLLQIQKITSTKVHESSYDGWQGNHVKAILQILRTILHEIYVVPKEREDRYQRIAEIRDEVQQKERTE